MTVNLCQCMVARHAHFLSPTIPSACFATQRGRDCSCDISRPIATGCIYQRWFTSAGFFGGLDMPAELMPTEGGAGVPEAAACTVFVL